MATKPLAATVAALGPRITHQNPEALSTRGPTRTGRVAAAQPCWRLVRDLSGDVVGPYYVDIFREGPGVGHGISCAA